MFETLGFLDWSSLGANAANIAAGVGLVSLGVIGLVLTALTLPGAWVTLLGAIVVRLLMPHIIEWRVIGLVGGLALLGEILEFVASSAGSARAGGTRRGGIGALVGSLVGAIAGAPLFFPLGTIVGGVAGAGAGAIFAERLWAKRGWRESARSGAGAAAGRAGALLIKIGLGLAIGILLLYAAIF